MCVSLRTLSIFWSADSLFTAMPVDAFLEMIRFFATLILNADESASL